MDDPEHINIDGYGQKLKTVAEECKERIEHLLDTADNGKILKEGIDTVIVGKPNAGKSSLMNVLLKKREGNCYGYCRNNERCLRRADEPEWDHS